ncbi:MAG: hypothetical protein DRN06_06005 [Thermoprotei archaeon]|nr:MAG: hypothetical protein DRN06_06005 [Thermoprotei archaeon]
MIMLKRVKAVLFDLNGTLAYVDNPISHIELSDLLLGKGYEVSPQQLSAAWFFVSIIDYPRYGYRSWRSFLLRVFKRLRVGVDKETLDCIVKLLESRPYRLYPDAASAVAKVRRSGFKTALVTTIARFQFEEAISPIKKFLDLIMTGYEAGCDKSNPRMYRRTLKILGVKAEEAVMVGDDVFLDVVLPKRLGMRAILLDRHDRGLSCDQADAVVSTLGQALRCIMP